MDPIQGIALGLQGALTPDHLLVAFLGCFWGTLIGVLPGIGPVGGLVLFLPLTYHMDPAAGILMMAAVYYGCQYGGSTTSILANIPGEATSVVTCLDGYKMGRQGRAGPALSIAAIGSFIAGTLGVVGVSFLAPALVTASLSFGPPEFFALMFLGLSMVSYLSGKSLAKGLLCALFGLMIASVGPHITTGTYRFTFGSLDLVGGISMVPIAVGVFGIGEVLSALEGDIKQSVLDVKLWQFWKLMPTRQDWRDSWAPILRGGVLGFFLGLLPGAAAIVATFMAYAVEKRVSKTPEKFGTGYIAGVAAPEAANNSATAGAMIPLLALGIPYNVITALMLNAMIAQGLNPSPLLMVKQPEFFWTVVASMYVGNLILLIMNLPLVGFWAAILKIPSQYLFPLILLFCISGVYANDYRVFELSLMVVFGVIGYLMRKVDFPGAPLLLGIVLGPMFENAMGQSLIISNGNWAIFVTRPISATIIGFSLLLLIWPILSALFKTGGREFLPKGQED